MDKPLEVFPLFRSTDETKAVTDLFVRGDEVSVADLVRRTGTNRRNVERSIDKLARADVISVRLVGRTKLVSACTTSVFYAHLKGLLEVTVGPPQVLSEVFEDVSGIESLFIFGSWAKRALGQEGHVPHDVDVLVISADANPGDITQACLDASQRLHREVNPQVVDPEAWEDRANRPDMKFWAGVANGPMVEVAHTTKAVAGERETSIEDVFKSLL